MSKCSRISLPRNSFISLMNMILLSPYNTLAITPLKSKRFRGLSNHFKEEDGSPNTSGMSSRWRISSKLNFLIG